MYTILVLCLVAIIKLCIVVKIKTLRTQEGETGCEQNTSNVLQSCEFCYFERVHVNAKNDNNI